MLTEAIGWPLAPGSGVAILFDCALKGAFLLLTVWVLLRLVLRRAPAAARYALCVAATGGLLALPAVSALAPRWSLPLPERWARLATEAPAIAPEEVSASRLSPQSAPLSLEPVEWLPPFDDEWKNNPFLTRGSGEKMEPRNDTVPPASDGIKGADRPDASAVSDETVAAAARVKNPPLAPSRADQFTFRWPSAPVMLTGAWAGGAAVAFLPWVVGLCALRRLLRRSRRIERGGAVEQLEALCRSLALPAPPLYETDRSLVPMAGSFFGSFILLPPDAAAWSEAKLRNVLTHEMGHVARRDDLAYLAARLAAALHWFNPFVWALLRVLRYERERACDDLVLRQGAASCDYASHLVEILKNASSVHPAMLAATPMACPRRLEKRIVAILDDHLNRKGLTMRNRITTLAVVTALTLSLGGATVTRSVETKEAQKENALQPSTGTQTETVVTRSVETKETPKRIPLQPPTKALTRTTITLKDVLVSARPDTSGPWVSSGLRFLCRGESNEVNILIFESEGAASHSEGVAPYSPNGDSNTGLAKTRENGSVKFLCSEANVGALVGKIGKEGTPFLIGERRAVRILESGVLYLGFNDAYGSPDDNTGSFKVYVGSYVRGEPTPLQKCLKNRLLIREAKAEWAKANGKQSSDVPKWDDLVGPDKALKEKPVCPEGGEYSLAGTEPEVTCSKHAETRWVAATSVQQTTLDTATSAVGKQATASAAPQEYTLPEGHVSAFGKDYQYAFLSGDGAGYKPPDYEGFFPDDEEAGKKLDDLLQDDAFNRTKWMDDDEVCRMVRQGLKRSEKKNDIMSWLGGTGHLGKSPQNPDAIEIAYHLYGDPWLRDNALSFGLSKIEPVKPAAVLKAFVEIAIKDGRFGGAVHSMQSGAKGQEKQILQYIEPYLKSDTEYCVQMAKQFQRIFSEAEGVEKPQLSPEDEEAQKKYMEKWKKEAEERKQAFFTMSDDERRQKIRGMNFLFGPGGENVEEDNKILDILAKYTKDSDQQVRWNIAREALGAYIGNTTDGKPNPKAVAMAIEMSKDPNPEVLKYVVCSGLAPIKGKSEEVVRTLLDIAYACQGKRDYSMFVAFGVCDALKEDRAVAKKLLDADLDGFLNDPEKALHAFEVYGDILEESPPRTPDWVAGMAVITGNKEKEVVFYLTAKDPKARTDLPAFRTAVRDTLLKNKERGERWLKQFYLDKSYKTWRALVSVPFQDRYVFPDFIKASDTFVILQDFPAYVTREEKAQRIANLRTPDLQIVKASDITPANAGETIKPLPAEAQAVLDKKKAQLEAERKALMAPSELQLKVNAAKPGDTIRLEAKEYVGVVTIDKPLTLEGAENRATLLSAKTFPPMETSQEAGKEIIPALLTIKGEGAVVLRDLRFKLETQGQGSCVILVNQAKAQIVGCEIEKAPWSGIGIMDSDAEIRDCRIGHLGRNGVSVRVTQGNREKTRVLVSGCDFIECVNVGLSIGEGCDNVTVEKCRISGSSWHGIRYDNASPKIVGNLISKNSRFGIYASGKTKATVKDNVFESGEMDGISCWFNSSDLIEGNTFVGNKRDAINIVGDSAPTIRHNIFAHNESGISFANTGQGDAQAENAGKPVIEANLFWDNKVDFPFGMNISEKKDANGRAIYEKPKLDAKSLTSDPKFIDAAGRNYGLQPDSPALAAGMGVKSHLPFEKAGADVKKEQEKP